jgi:putative glutamine amidotransferase
MSTIRSRPVILISCSHEPFEISGFGVLPHHAVFERYVEAVVAAIDCTPLLLPAIGRPELAREYVDLADGAVLTGAASNVEPRHYGASCSEDPSKLDPLRDETTLPFIRAAVAAGLPLLGICRGMQELNVALGGTLHHRVHEVPGRADHRAPRDCALPDRYLPKHGLTVTEDSWLSRLLAAKGVGVDGLRVNSLHGQAVDALGRGVVVEATADDGTVEAIRAAGAPALALGVQWHPEWYLDRTPLNRAIFEELGRASWERLSARSAGGARKFVEAADVG